MTAAPENDRPRPPLQFGLGSLLALTAMVSVLCGILRWAEVPPGAMVMVLLILVVSIVAAVGLVVAIARSSDDGP